MDIQAKTTAFTSPKEALLLVNIACSLEQDCFPLALENQKAARAYLEKLSDHQENIYIASYPKSETLVEKGHVLATDPFLASPLFSYAQVPLGFILQGEVIITKGGKATKRLGAGDFIGLFETGDWLVCGQNRHIGDWTLTANQDTQILYFGSGIQEDENFRKYLVNVATADNVPKPLTDLPLLDWVASHTTPHRLEEYAIIAHTHLLPNNFPFFRHLAHLVPSDRMFIMEKPYSTVPSVKNQLVQSGIEVVDVRMEPGAPYEYAVEKSLDILWRKVIHEQRKTGFTKLLIVDDGGDLWLSIPWTELEGVSIVGVEQTQRGITRVQGTKHRIPPIVSVAGSGIKKIVEAIFIGEAVVNELEKAGELSGKKIGVLGLGSIGKATIDSLKKRGVHPFFYDPVNQNTDIDDPCYQPSIDTLFNQTDLIIGTTGSDGMKGVAWERIRGTKKVASASSADVEFATLLKLAPPTTDAFGTREVPVHEDLEISVLNGGYPVNFTRIKDSTPDEDIVLTRCLMYIGAMEAVKLEQEDNEPGIYGLDITAQEKLLTKWIKDKQSKELACPVAINQIKGVVTFGTDRQTPGPAVWEEGTNDDYLKKLDEQGLHITTRTYLEKVEAHMEPYDVDVFGKMITILPGVMSPKYDWAGLYMIDRMAQDFTGKDVLELGPGSGLVSVFAGLRGANSVTAADVNPKAVENTRLNLEKFHIPNAEVYQSDVFSGVPKKKYDVIIFNLPYHEATPKNDLERGVADEDYRVMDAFFVEVKNYLKEDGIMYIGFSRSGNEKRFHDAVKKNNIKLEKFEEQNSWNQPGYEAPEFLYNCQVYTLSL